MPGSRNADLAFSARARVEAGVSGPRYLLRDGNGQFRQVSGSEFRGSIFNQPYSAAHPTAAAARVVDATRASEAVTVDASGDRLSVTSAMTAQEGGIQAPPTGAENGLTPRAALDVSPEATSQTLVEAVQAPPVAAEIASAPPALDAPADTLAPAQASAAQVPTALDAP